MLTSSFDPLDVPLAFLSQVGQFWHRDEHFVFPWRACFPACQGAAEFDLIQGAVKPTDFVQERTDGTVVARMPAEAIAAAWTKQRIVSALPVAIELLGIILLPIRVPTVGAYNLHHRRLGWG